MLGRSQSVPPAEYRKGLRYLLHASGENYDDDAVLFVGGDYRNSSVWGRIASQLLGREGARWRYVPDVLANKLSAAHRDEQIGERDAPIAQPTQFSNDP